MVEFEEIFNPENEKTKDEKDKLFKSVRKLSEKIGETSGASIFITVEDAINSKSKIFLIKDGSHEESEITSNLVEA